MIAGIRGTIDGKGQDFVTVDVGGVSFRAVTSRRTLGMLGDLGTPVSLATYLHVREDSLVLFGFATDEERQAFELLIGVTGIGPKAAMAILSSLGPGELATAVKREDAARLGQVQGVGAKTAARLVLELRGKVDGLLTDECVAQDVDGDLVSALQSLGYTSQESKAAAASVGADSTAEMSDRVIQALRYFQRDS